MKAIFALLLTFLALPLHAAQTSVSAPRYWVEGDTTSVAFELSKTARYTMFALSNPHRVVIDFRDSRYTGNASQTVSGHPLIRRIRGGARPGGDYRVVLDLLHQATPSSFLAENGKRLVVELKGKGGAPVVSRQAKVDRPAAIPASKAVNAPIITTAAPPASAEQGLLERLFGSNPSNQIHRAPPASAPYSGRDVVVVIDAGHGGYDIGAQGKHGTHEKDVVLGIAKHLATLIDREEGMRAVLTRKGDYFIQLRDRMQIARDASADLFISVHANGYINTLAKGASVYILSPKGASSEAARLLAEKENSAESIGNIGLDGKDDDLRAVLIDLSQSATIQESHDVASRVLARMGGLGRIHLRSVQKAGFAVLKSPDVPSILVETAFITNPEEERKLRSGETQQAFASAILDGARDYFYSHPPPGSLIAAKTRQERTLAEATPPGRSVPES